MRQHLQQLELTNTERWFVLAVVLLFLLGLAARQVLQHQAASRETSRPAEAFGER